MNNRILEASFDSIAEDASSFRALLSSWFVERRFQEARPVLVISFIPLSGSAQANEIEGARPSAFRSRDCNIPFWKSNQAAPKRVRGWFPEEKCCSFRSGQPFVKLCRYLYGWHEYITTQ